MNQGFSGISEIADNENFVSKISEKAEAITNTQTSEFISQNPEFWNKIDDYSKKCCNIFLHCLEPLEKDIQKNNMPTKNPYVFFDTVIVSLQGAYAERNNIPYGDNAPPVERDVDLKWREDTLFLLILLKEIVSHVLPEETPLTIQMWFGGDLYSFMPHLGDMMITTSTLSGVSKIQRLKECKASFLSEISYISLQKLSSGEYVPYSKDDSFPAQFDEFKTFFRGKSKLEKAIYQIATTFSEVTNCDYKKIISIFKVYCFRRWKTVQLHEDDIINYLHSLIHKDFHFIITEFIKSFEQLDKLARDLREIDARRKNNPSGCLVMLLLLPIFAIIALTKALLN
ncbi:MAG: hypothetical protein GX928_03810 [Ruminococcaceae bacterium]|nr:hypothetical protein [Oscillospiraceae bacterium]